MVAPCSGPYAMVPPQSLRSDSLQVLRLETEKKHRDSEVNTKEPVLIIQVLIVISTCTYNKWKIKAHPSEKCPTEIMTSCHKEDLLESRS